MPTHRPRTGSCWRALCQPDVAAEFRTDDVLLEMDFAPEQRLKLEKLLASLPRKTFLADDSLGWVYQFWQSKKKEEVNKSSAGVRTAHALRRHATFHRILHGGVPASQHHRGVVVRNETASRGHRAVLAFPLACHR